MQAQIGEPSSGTVGMKDSWNQVWMGELAGLNRLERKASMWLCTQLLPSSLPFPVAAWEFERGMHSQPFCFRGVELM